MALTVRELLLNHSRGIGSNVHMYDENAYFDTEIPTFDDINDLKEYKENLKQQYENLQDELKRQKKENSDILNKSLQATEDKNAE